VRAEYGRQVRRLSIAIALAALLLFPATGAAKPRHVHGSWQNPEPLSISSLDPVTGAYKLSGGSQWQGTFSGATTFTSDGHTNLLTGETEGTIDETFTGSTPRGRAGTLHLTETVSVAPMTGDTTIVAHIDGGTGVFKRSRGKVTFTGHTDQFTGTGSGAYTGVWRRPPR
jgi:hypothetical protein